MITAEHVNKIFERGWWVIERQTEGISHEDSLLQPPFQGNCMNWVLGHLLFERQHVLKNLGLEAMLPDEVVARYAFDSDPITSDSPDVIRLPDLLSNLKEAGSQIAEGLHSIDDQKWNSVIDENGTKLWERIEFLAWHEGYHVGQLELLRQLTGKNDKVI